MADTRKPETAEEAHRRQYEQGVMGKVNIAYEKYRLVLWLAFVLLLSPLLKKYDKAVSNLASLDQKVTSLVTLKCYEISRGRASADEARLSGLNCDEYLRRFGTQQYPSLPPRDTSASRASVTPSIP